MTKKCVLYSKFYGPTIWLCYVFLVFSIFGVFLRGVRGLGIVMLSGSEGVKSKKFHAWYRSHSTIHYRFIFYPDSVVK